MGQPRPEGGVRQVENVLCRVLKTRMLFLTLSEMVGTFAVSFNSNRPAHSLTLQKKIVKKQRREGDTNRGFPDRIRRCLPSGLYSRNRVRCN